MYLKSIEMIGFKSFADKTKLEFEPGMTAVVGPNGCGKSNISDAVRWVIGEQSAKALRGRTMEDCIFGGTDERKPLGMAEVSLTLADCEDALESDYHEITVTRRVYRSGEGHYFINKTACRLKDIQRLFLGTGIGTASYSVMEQGRIDYVLSSRPEDRRLIFEEASGITKFKTDKKEAVRKLDHTEANLLRLGDVVREVKRQIGSLQRQAGKARRYASFREELGKLDLFVARRHLQKVDTEMDRLAHRASELGARRQAVQAELDETSKQAADLHKGLVSMEREIGSALEAVVASRSDLEHTRESIQVNEQRIEEYRTWSERDSREVNDARSLINDKRQALQELTGRIEKDRVAREEAAAAMKVCHDAHEARRTEIDAARTRIHRLRERSVELESLLARLQNELIDIESHEQSAVIRRERLAAERGQTEQVATGYERRCTEMQSELRDLTSKVQEAETALAALGDEVRDLTGQQREQQQQEADLRSRIAALQAQMEFLLETAAAGEGMSAGARLLLNPEASLPLEQDRILGSLADRVSAPPDCRTALEACLRSWLDAVLVTDAGELRRVLGFLESQRPGSARLLATDTDHEPQPVPAGAGVPLLDCLTCDRAIQALMRRLIGHVRLVDDLQEIPETVPAGCAYVTRAGSLVSADGSAEFWTTEGPLSNPLSRKQATVDCEQQLSKLQVALEECRARGRTLAESSARTATGVDAARNALESCRRALAQKEGEHQIVSREASEARDRLETVTWELGNLDGQDENGSQRKQEISARLKESRAQRERVTSDTSDANDELQALENRYSELQTDVTEHRVTLSEAQARLERTTREHESAQSRVEELESIVQGRSKGLQSYAAGIDRLQGEIETASSRVEELEQEVRRHTERSTQLRQENAARSEKLAQVEPLLEEQRASIEDIREERSTIDIHRTENQMRRRNIIDRVASDYALTPEQVEKGPEPDWGEQGAPPLEQVETRVAELRTKIEAMGPVNLVAIQEYKDLEERYAFLTTQEADLTKARLQLLDMIRKIDQTTSDMFRKTFDQANKNFQQTFRNLFNGGSAKLVLVNEEDVLECGIEIIARPPGKRLQRISLLSGGERTLTAVALLFAIYMIKPSPFCLLDELDAALDDANIGRFNEMLRGFLAQSQFLVITHNRQSITAADVLYGVTMPDKGVSRIVSMKLQPQEQESAEQQPAASRKS